ncbi:MAG: hypothetical protein HY608_08530 [Planctomycetes bacterium]|nr:hypothetical protein [Planctomycetota bacterium]
MRGLIATILCLGVAANAVAGVLLQFCCMPGPDGTARLEWIGSPCCRHAPGAPEGGQARIQQYVARENCVDLEYPFIPFPGAGACPGSVGVSLPVPVVPETVLRPVGIPPVFVDPLGASGPPLHLQI